MLEVTFTIIRRNQFYKLVAATQQLNKNIESLGAPNFCLHNYIHRIVKKKNDFYTCKKSRKFTNFDSQQSEIFSEARRSILTFKVLRFHEKFPKFYEEISIVLNIHIGTS